MKTLYNIKGTRNAKNTDLNIGGVTRNEIHEIVIPSFKEKYREIENEIMELSFSRSLKYEQLQEKLVNGELANKLKKDLIAYENHLNELLDSESDTFEILGYVITKEN